MHGIDNMMLHFDVHRNTDRMPWLFLLSRILLLILAHGIHNIDVDHKVQVGSCLLFIALLECYLNCDIAHLIKISGVMVYLCTRAHLNYDCNSQLFAPLYQEHHFYLYVIFIFIVITVFVILTWITNDRLALVFFVLHCGSVT